VFLSSVTVAKTKPMSEILHTNIKCNKLSIMSSILSSTTKQENINAVQAGALNTKYYHSIHEDEDGPFKVYFGLKAGS